jgi:peptidoglycan hydrolase CwlO-like protein
MTAKKKAIVMFVLGLVLGLALAIALPAQAHCGLRTRWRHCWGYVTALQSAVNSLQSQIANFQSQVASLQSKVASLQSQVDSLGGKTGELTSLGTYTGSLDQVEIPLFCAGDPAVWESFGDGLDC